MSDVSTAISFTGAINPLHAEAAITRLGVPPDDLRFARLDFTSSRHIDVTVGWRLGNAMRRHANASLLEVLIPNWDEETSRDWFLQFTRSGLGQAMAYHCEFILRGSHNVAAKLRDYYARIESKHGQNHFFAPQIRERRHFNVDNFDSFMTHLSAATRFIPVRGRVFSAEFLPDLATLIFEAAQNVYDHAHSRPLPNHTKVFDYLCLNFFSVLSAAPDPTGRFANYVKHVASRPASSKTVLGYLEIIVNDDGVGIAARQSQDSTIYWDPDVRREADALLEALDKGGSVKFRTQDAPIRHDPGFGIPKIAHALRRLEAFATLRTGRLLAVFDPCSQDNEAFVLFDQTLGYMPGTALDVIVPIPDEQLRLPGLI